MRSSTFHLPWIYQTAKSLANSTQMHFGVNFRGVLGTTLVHQSAHILETLALEWLNVFWLVPFLLGTII